MNLPYTLIYMVKAGDLLGAAFKILYSNIAYVGTANPPHIENT